MIETFEVVLKRMLDRVSTKVDKREGAVIYDALAPAAIEFENVNFKLDYMMKQAFADTADREHLVRRAKERGLKPKSATSAIMGAIFNMEIPIGSRFSLEELNYFVKEKIRTVGTDIYYTVECETPGSLPNGKIGKLLPINYINGLTKAEILTMEIPGEDEEDTEDFRKRYFASFDFTPYGGNIADYKLKTTAINGVGPVLVTPVWNGGGTVKVTILDSDYNVATQELIDTVQEILDPTPQGQGLGVAPIDHVVTVNTATTVVINVTGNIVLNNGVTVNQIQSQINEVIKNYLLDLRKNWSPDAKLVGNETVVRTSNIISKLLDIQDVADINNLKINGSTSNLTLTMYQVPTFGSVVLS